MSEDQQQFIDGTRDPVPDEVQALAEQYVATLRARMAMQRTEKDQKDRLAEAMVEHDIERIETPTDVVKRKHVENDKIEVSKKAVDDEED